MSPLRLVYPTRPFRAYGIIWAVSEIGVNRDHLQSQLDDLSIPVIFLTMGARDNMFIVAVDNYQRRPWDLGNP